MEQTEARVVRVFVVANHGLVWNTSDVLWLRREKRIVGVLVGNAASNRRKWRFDVRNSAALPLLLSGEEVDLLLGQGCVALVDADQVLRDPPSPDTREKQQSFLDDSFREQVKLFRERRRDQVISMLDKIVSGKRKKLRSSQEESECKKRRKLGSGDSVFEKNQESVDENAAVVEEMSRIEDITREQAVLQVLTAHPFPSRDLPEATWSFPSTKRDACRSRVFSDLWSKSFFITDGEKFGADFLAYPGDPMRYHAQFIIMCVEGRDQVRRLEQNREMLSAKCRLGTLANKRFLVAYLEDKTVKYKAVTFGENEVNKAMLQC